MAVKITETTIICSRCREVLDGPHVADGDSLQGLTLPAPMRRKLDRDGRVFDEVEGSRVFDDEELAREEVAR